MSTRSFNTLPSSPHHQHTRSHPQRINNQNGNTTQSESPLPYFPKSTADRLEGRLLKRQHQRRHPTPSSNYTFPAQPTQQQQQQTFDRSPSRLSIDSNNSASGIASSNRVIEDDYQLTGHNLDFSDSELSTGSTYSSNSPPTNFNESYPLNSQHYRRRSSIASPASFASSSTPMSLHHQSWGNTSNNLWDGTTNNTTTNSSSEQQQLSKSYTPSSGLKSSINLGDPRMNRRNSAVATSAVNSYSRHNYNYNYPLNSNSNDNCNGNGNDIGNGSNNNRLSTSTSASAPAPVLQHAHSSPVPTLTRNPNSSSSTATRRNLKSPPSLGRVDFFAAQGESTSTSSTPSQSSSDHSSPPGSAHVTASTPATHSNINSTNPRPHTMYIPEVAALSSPTSSLSTSAAVSSSSPHHHDPHSHFHTRSSPSFASNALQELSSPYNNQHIHPHNHQHQNYINNINNSPNNNNNNDTLSHAGSIENNNFIKKSAHHRSRRSIGYNTTSPTSPPLSPLTSVSSVEGVDRDMSSLTLGTSSEGESLSEHAIPFIKKIKVGYNSNPYDTISTIVKRFQIRLSRNLFRHSVPVQTIFLTDSDESPYVEVSYVDGKVNKVTALGKSVRDLLIETEKHAIYLRQQDYQLNLRGSTSSSYSRRQS